LILKKQHTIKNFRWWIIGLIALATAINYLDRQNLPVALGEIRKSFSITDAEYGLINSLFLLAYGIMYGSRPDEAGGYGRRRQALRSPPRHHTNSSRAQLPRLRPIRVPFVVHRANHWRER